MITLLLDTAYLGLNIGIVKDDQLIEKTEIIAQRKQSELTLPMLAELFKKHDLKPLDINQIVITEGPGSFTGLRIAMTIAKVICSMTECQLHTINTLLAYVHPDIDSGLAIMDARSKRAYVAKVEHGQFVENPQTVELEDIHVGNHLVFGDGQLIGVDSTPFSIIENMLAHKQHWQLVNDVDALVPLYLKENQEYGH